MGKRVVDVPDTLLILAGRYVGKDRYYANFSELVRDGVRMAVAKAKRSGVDRIGTKKFLEQM